MVGLIIFLSLLPFLKKKIKISFSGWCFVRRVFSLVLFFFFLSCLPFFRPLPAFLSHISLHFLKNGIPECLSRLQVAVFQLTGSFDPSVSFTQCERKGLKCLSTVHMIQFHLNKSSLCPAEMQEISTWFIYLLAHQKGLSWRKATEIKVNWEKVERIK